MLFYVKLFVVLIAIILTGIQLFSLGAHFKQAIKSPYYYKAIGTVVDVVKKPENKDFKKIPDDRGYIDVSYEINGEQKVKRMNRANSAGLTRYADKEPGDTWIFHEKVSSDIKGSFRIFKSKEISKVLMLFGCFFLSFGAVLFLI